MISIVAVDVTTLIGCQQYDYFCWDVNSMISIVTVDMTA